MRARNRVHAWFMTAATLPQPAPQPFPLLLPDGQFSLGELHAMKLDGVVQHLVGDAFRPAGVPPAPGLRAGALAAQVPASLAGRTIVGLLSAAWVYGCAPPPYPLELLLTPGGKSALLPPFSGCTLRQIRLGAGDVWELAGTWVTSPVRTAADIARSVPEPHATDVLAAMAARADLECPLDRMLAAAWALRHVPGRLRALELLRRLGADAEAAGPPNTGAAGTPSDMIALGPPVGAGGTVDVKDAVNAAHGVEDVVQVLGIPHFKGEL